MSATTGRPASASSSGRDAAGHLEAEGVGPGRARRARRRGRRAPAPAPANVTSTVCAPRWRSSASVPSSTSRPSRRIPTRSQSASTSLRMCEERKTVCPRALRLLHASRGRPSPSAGRARSSARRASAGRRGWRSAATSWTFCRLPFDSARTFFDGVELEALDEHVAVGRVGPAPCRRARNSSVSAPVSAGHRNGSPAT